MVTDRKKLEEVLAEARRNISDAYDRSYTGSVPAAEKLQVLADAAQKHLDTLPKPSHWRVTGLTSSYIRDKSLPYADREIALDIAKAWLRVGYINVSVLEVPA